MARKTKTDTDGQLDLIEVGPENAKALKRAANAYVKAHDSQLAAKLIADGKLDTLMQRVKEAELEPLADGTIKFRVGGMVVKVGKPTSRLTIKNADEESETEETDANAKFGGRESDE